MTDNRHYQDGDFCGNCIRRWDEHTPDERGFPHARAFGESLGKRLDAVLPSIGTWYVRPQVPPNAIVLCSELTRYRATYARGAKGITAPIHAELQATIYARDDIDAERYAEYIARDRVCFLIACARA